MGMIDHTKQEIAAQREARIVRFAEAALQGMLAHPTPYKPRAENAHLHWHNAIAQEAHELAIAMEEQLYG